VIDGTEVELIGRAAEVVRLVVASGGQVDVDVVIDALWPDIAPDIGHERLRTVLARVPHCPHRLLVRHGDTLALARGVVLDVADFETAARRALTARARGDRSWVALAGAALDYYRGDLFAGRGEELWALGPRERLRRRYLTLLDALAREAESSGDWSRSLALLDQAIECDPADESRYLLAAKALMSQGRHAAALCLLRRARSVLRDLGLPLPVELKALEANLHA
jgi:DNA-binding SARP family transcriptional activator